MHNSSEFSRAASRYDAFSSMQRRIAGQLAQCSRAYITDKRSENGLDIGCGSGAATLAFMPYCSVNRMIGIDRAGGMCRRYTHITGHAAIQASADHVPIKSGGTGLVISSMALHWLSSEQRLQAFKGIRRIGTEGAVLCVALPVRGSLACFFSMLDAASATPLRRLCFPEAQQCVEELRAAGLNIVSIVEDDPEEYFTEPGAMLRYTKHIGANITGNPAGYPGKMFFRTFADIFRDASEPGQGVAMRWRVAYMIAALD